MLPRLVTNVGRVGARLPHTFIRPLQVRLFQACRRPTCHSFSTSVEDLPHFEKSTGDGETAASSNGVIESHLNVVGWIQSVRRHKTRVFFDLADGSSPFNLQVVASPSLISENLRVGSAVSVAGDLMHPPYVNQSHVRADLHARSVRLLDGTDPTLANAPSPLVGAHGANTPRPDLGLLRSTDGLSWRHRLPELSAMLRIRARVKQIARRIMDQLEYLEVDTPILTSVDCEGSSQTFMVQSSLATAKPTSSTVALTGSAQLHLEALALGMSKVYTLNPSFRAETSHTRNHLAEFYMLEAESVHLDTIDRLCAEIETIVRLLVMRFLENFTSKTNDHLDEDDVDSESPVSAAHGDLVLVNTILTLDDQQSDRTESVRSQLSLLESSLNKPFVRLTFDEACAHLDRPVGAHTDLSKEEERQVLAWVGGQQPVLLTHFPCTLKPFYCHSMDGVHAEAVDLLVPGVGELVGGSVRETCATELTKRINASGTNLQNLEWYVNLRGHGGAPHGGFGLGFERLLQFLTGVYNIRDVIPFPRVADKIYL